MRHSSLSIKLFSFTLVSFIASFFTFSEIHAAPPSKKAAAPLAKSEAGDDAAKTAEKTIDWKNASLDELRPYFERRVGQTTFATLVEQPLFAMASAGGARVALASAGYESTSMAPMMAKGMDVSV